jgi:hypothetical protein
MGTVVSLRALSFCNKTTYFSKKTKKDTASATTKPLAKLQSSNTTSKKTFQK